MPLYRIVSTLNNREQPLSEWTPSRSDAMRVLDDTHPALRPVLRVIAFVRDDEVFGRVDR